MTEKKRKLTAKRVRNLYLYPYRTKKENLDRGIILIASWIIGIVTQQAANQQALGGAYLIFVCTLLLEFALENREDPLARVVQGVFDLVLIFILIGSLLLIFSNSSNTPADFEFPYMPFVTFLPHAGWIVFVVILIGIALALFDAHKFFYDEEAEARREREAEQEAERERFEERLSGPPKGGNKQ